MGKHLDRDVAEALEWHNLYVGQHGEVRRTGTHCVFNPSCEERVAFEALIRYGTSFVVGREEEGHSYVIVNDCDTIEHDDVATAICLAILKDFASEGNLNG